MNVISESSIGFYGSIKGSFQVLQTKDFKWLPLSYYMYGLVRTTQNLYYSANFEYFFRKGKYQHSLYPHLLAYINC
jgi:hypothetical protein